MKSVFIRRDIMIYKNDLKDMWDEYAIKKTTEEDHREEMERATDAAREEGVEKGAEKTKMEFVKNLLDTGKFSVAEIANYANVSEAYIRNVKKEMK